jgi:hypothetical protein
LSARMIRNDTGPVDADEWLQSHLAAAHAAATERRKATEARKREAKRRRKLALQLSPPPRRPT